MKLGVPVNEDQETICVSFGRTPLFLLFDTENGARVLLDNPATTAPGGAGIQAAQFIVEKGVEALLTPRCGENAAKVLEAAGIKMYQTTSSDAEGEIHKFNQGHLEILQEIHAGFHNHGFEQ